MTSVSSIAATTQSEHEFSLWHVASATPVDSDLMVAPQKPPKRVTFGAVTIVEITPRNFLDSSATLDSLPSPVDSDSTPEMIEDVDKDVLHSLPLGGTKGRNKDESQGVADYDDDDEDAAVVEISLAPPSATLPGCVAEQKECLAAAPPSLLVLGSSSSETVDPTSDPMIHTPLRQMEMFRADAEPVTTARVIAEELSSTSDDAESQMRKSESLQFFLKTLREAQRCAIGGYDDEAQREPLLTPSLHLGGPTVKQSSVIVISSSSTSGSSSGNINTCDHNMKNASIQLECGTDLRVIDDERPAAASSSAASGPPPAAQTVPCVFCSRTDGSDLIFQSPYWFHANCALWSPEVCGDPLTNRLLHVEDAVKRGSQIKCAFCRQRGATIGCLLSSCERSYHFACAVACGASLRVPAFELKCPKHSKSPAKRPRDA